MKTIIAAGVVAGLSATTVMADGYTAPITKDGVNYLCKDQTIVVDGAVARECIRDTGAQPVSITSQGPLLGGLFGAGLSTGAAIGLGVLTIGVVGAALDDDDDSTTGTN